MKFIDTTEIRVQAGKGGDGLVSFRSGPHAPKMGADGGDGGDGGSVYLVGDEGLNTLSCFRYKKLYAAEPGRRGGSNGRTGRRGKDLILRVPLGTVVRNQANQKVIAEITQPGEKICIARGGQHGLGNLKFLRPHRQAPDYATPGKEGEAFELQLELKLMADVGLTGFPNAGKSTLLSALTAARPKIADYPFTTLHPQLGVVEASEDNTASRERAFVIADVPGLIKGAAQGKGLGHDFLRHLERTRIIAFVLDPFTLMREHHQPARAQFEALNQELINFNPLFAQKKRVIIISKMDLTSLNEDWQQEKDYFERQGWDVYCVSSANRQGLEALKNGLFHILCQLNKDNSSTAQDKAKNQPLPKLSDFQLVNPQRVIS